MARDYLGELLREKNSTFTTKEAALIWKETGVSALQNRLSRYNKAGKIRRIRKGIYAKDETYEKRELATKIYTPSYISFETALIKAGIIFQYYEQIFVASYLRRELMITGQKYIFHKIKDAVLTDPAGIENHGTYSIASPERAFLDTIYLYKDYFFDNLRSINWNTVYEILPIYENTQMEKEVREQQKLAKERY